MSFMGDVLVEKQSYPNRADLVRSPAVHQGDAFPDRRGPATRGLATNVSGGADTTTLRVGAPVESIVGATVAFPRRLGLAREVMVT